MAQTPTTDEAPAAFDLNAYTHHLSESDLSDAEKIDVLNALHHILIGILDLKYGTDATSRVCGKSDDKPSSKTRAVVHCFNTNSDKPERMCATRATEADSGKGGKNT